MPLHDLLGYGQADARPWVPLPVLQPLEHVEDFLMVLWSDPDLEIRWPIAEPQVSPKDAKAPQLKDADHNFVYRRS